MNLNLSDSLLGRQRSKQWTPLITQQFRLRHVYQIFGLNFAHLPRNGAYYYTLHSTSMSAPFYTSQQVDSANPKWPELDQRHVQNLGTTAMVLRVWQHTQSGADSVVSTWGVNFSGLVYLGNKITEIQPTFFLANTVIFNIRGGFFTSQHSINGDAPRKAPFLDSVGLRCDKIFRRTRVQCLKSEVRDSYDIGKLRRLQSLQVTIKNRSLDVQSVREKIEARLGSDGLESEGLPEPARTASSTSNVRYAPQLLTMKSVNKMLEEKPTKLQRKEMEKIRNEIEVAQFKSKLLSQERDKKSALIRRSKGKLKDLVDKNEDKSSNLTEEYYKLSRETEKYRDKLKTISHHQNVLATLHSQLNHRRRQLLQQLLFIYPIQRVSDKKYMIHGVYLPNSDVLSDCSDAGISVALGYITHILVMSSMFLQVPLRYHMTHYGSRSYVTDHVSPILPDREREFPLFTKGKEKLQFTYGVYLLNKNIAQLRWLFFMETPELKATLPNLLTFLEGRDARKPLPVITASLGAKIEAEPLEKIEETVKSDFPKKVNSKFFRSCECGPGLSEILAIPEAFLNKQISSDSFKNFAALKNSVDNIKSAAIVIKEGVSDCDNTDEEVIDEEGTDMLDPALDLREEVTKTNGASESENEDVKKILQSVESPLTARTDALLNTKSFNLVKTKPNL